MPLDNEGLVMPPAGAHFAEGLPERRRGEALGARDDPHLEQNTEDSLTKLLSYAVCKYIAQEVKGVKNQHY